MSGSQVRGSHTDSAGLFYDPEMALFAMEYLTPHVILRKELINGKKFPKLAEDIGRFLAQTLFNTSDIGMSAEQKKRLLPSSR